MYMCRIEHLIQGEASQRASAARPLPRVRHLTVPTMVGKTIPLPICSILKMSEAPEGARFNSFLAALNIDKESLGRPDSGADIRNGGENRDGTRAAIILHHGDPMRRIPAITLTPSSTKSWPTMDACTWITFGCRNWICADMHLTVRLRPQRKHSEKRKNCIQCRNAIKQSKAWAKKMGLIAVEAGKEEEEPMMSDADDNEDRVG